MSKSFFGVLDDSTFQLSCNICGPWKCYISPIVGWYCAMYSELFDPEGEEALSWGCRTPWLISSLESTLWSCRTVRGNEADPQPVAKALHLIGSGGSFLFCRDLAVGHCGNSLSWHMPLSPTLPAAMLLHSCIRWYKLRKERSQSRVVNANSSFQVPSLMLARIDVQLSKAAKNTK